MTDNKERHRYDEALLYKCLQRDGATLIGEYTGGGRRSIIKYRCACGNEREKTFCLIVSASAICLDCLYKKQIELLSKGRTEENRQKALQTRGNHDDETKVYSRKSLDQCLVGDRAQLLGSYPLLFGTTQIKFICRCGCETERKFQDILGRTTEKREKGYCGALCEECNKKRWLKTREETNIKRYNKKGGINITEESKQKSIRTSMEKYNVPSPNMAESVKQKKIQTNLIKRGVENPAQSIEVMECTQKNAKKYKEYKMPSGTIRKIQGYEPFALDVLVKSYTEEQIKTDRKDVPRIKYEVDEKKKYYFPDIFLPHENKLIEVKSTWTYKCKTDNINKKAEACKKQGYNYEIWCFDAKGKRVEV